MACWIADGCRAPVVLIIDEDRLIDDKDYGRTTIVFGFNPALLVNHQERRIVYEISGALVRKSGYDQEEHMRSGESPIGRPCYFD